MSRVGKTSSTCTTNKKNIFLLGVRGFLGGKKSYFYLISRTFHIGNKINFTNFLKTKQKTSKKSKILVHEKPKIDEKKNFFLEF